jgi:transcription initiation factor TFIIH subunit 4
MTAVGAVSILFCVTFVSRRTQILSLLVRHPIEILIVTMADPEAPAQQTTPETKTSGVLDYLQKCLSSDDIFALYTDETRGRYVCRAVLQQLSRPAQQVVLRLMCTGGSFPLSGVKVWGKNMDKVLRELQRWSIIDAAQLATTVVVTEGFAGGLQQSLQSLDQSPWLPLSEKQIQELEQEANEPHKTTTIEDLEHYTQAQWDCVLHFLVGTTGEKEPPPAVVHFLLQTNLMQPDPDFKGAVDDAPLVITQIGYDFMLSDMAIQIWHFIKEYLASLSSHKKGKELRIEALLLLICLSFGRPGDAYLTSTSLTKDARIMVKDLCHFGLLYTRKIGKHTVFYPTRVALQLVSNPDDTTSAVGVAAQWTLSSKALEAALAHPTPEDSSHLAVIVQTNFQVCAYTTSELHVSMLALFCDVSSIRRLPNVVFMAISRDSIKSAFSLGIQARQILKFLHQHAHPRLRVKTVSGSAAASPIPANVVDQIWLWDKEQTRVQFQEVYQHDCVLQGEFDAVSQYAADHKALVWSQPSRQLLFLDYAQVERISQFARLWRAKTATKQKNK